MKTLSMPMHTPACELVDLSTEGSLNRLKGRITTRMNLLMKVPTGETTEPVEVIADGFLNEVEKAKYQYHGNELQAEFSKVEKTIGEFSLTGQYSIERLQASMQSLIDVIDEQISML